MQPGRGRARQLPVRCVTPSQAEHASSCDGCGLRHKSAAAASGRQGPAAPAWSSSCCDTRQPVSASVSEITACSLCCSKLARSAAGVPVCSAPSQCSQGYLLTGFGCWVTCAAVLCSFAVLCCVNVRCCADGGCGACGWWCAPIHTSWVAAVASQSSTTTTWITLTTAAAWWQDTSTGTWSWSLFLSGSKSQARKVGWFRV